MDEKIWKATMYLRLSKEDSGHKQESSSIQNQRELINDFISKNENIEIVSIKIDDGYTGTNFDRPAFNEMMEDVRDKLVDCVIVKDLSRFGRDHLEAGNYIQNIFPILKVRFIAVLDNIDTLFTQPSDNFLIPIKNYVNSVYSKEISKKISSSLKSLRVIGHIVSAFVCYGYVRSNEEKGKLLIDRNVSGIIREIFDLKLSGWSSEKIANYLNDNGYLSPSEYKKKVGLACSTKFKTKAISLWYATTVIRILSNPIYIGTLEQGKSYKSTFKYENNKPKRVQKPETEWDIIEDNHEPIIDKSIFGTVQKILKTDTRKSPNESVCYIFSGMLHCNSCGQNLKRKTSTYKDKKYVYYSCPTCKGVRIKEDLLIDTVEKTVKLTINERVIVSELFFNTDITKYTKLRIEKLQNNINILEDSITTIRKYKQGLYESFIDKIVNQDDFETFNNEYSYDIEKISNTIANIKDEISVISQNNNNNNLWIENFKQNKNITELNRTIATQLIDTICLDTNNIVIINFSFQSEYNKILEFLKQFNNKAYTSRLTDTEVCYG